MELIRGLHNLKPAHRGCVATIGNFDGVHRGHAEVIRGVIDRAGALGLPGCAITFEPQPQEYLAPERAPPRLTRFAEKFRLLQALGIDRLLVLNFDRNLAALAAQAFIRRVLVDGLGIRVLVVGDDFRFGHARRGDIAMLREAGAVHGFEVRPTAGFMSDGQRVSSTRVRDLLGAGDLRGAAGLLGRAYALSGRVGYGRRLGRTLGFPTANVDLGRTRPPLRGVFAVSAALEGDAADLPGVANLGMRPTVDGSRLALEVQLFDFDRDIYGRRLTVSFLHKLREEQKFTGLDALKMQIARDGAAARAFLARRAAPG